MSVDERARHRLYLKLEEVLGAEEAGILMDHLPPTGFGDLVTKGDLDLIRAATKSDIEALRVETKSDIEALRVETKSDIEALRVETKSEFASVRADLQALEHKLTSRIDRSARQLMAWVSGMVLATGGLAFTAGRFV